MKIALIYPPTCDPTAPYISVPALTGYLRAKGVDVLPVDANVEAWDLLLRKPFLCATAQRLAGRLAKLSRSARLSHVEQLAYAHLRLAEDIARSAPAHIADAMAVLRDRSGVRFFDPAAYNRAVDTIESALELISAAYTPLSLDFAAFQTPFSMLDMDSIMGDAQPSRNPFHDYFDNHLCRLLARENVNMVGISVAFPGQLQPAYALALAIRRRLPGVYITAGGPAFTQLMLRLNPTERDAALGPFDSVVLFEGEEALFNLVTAVTKGEKPCGVIEGGNGTTDLNRLPPPDFDGLPLEKYFAPEPVLPYDPTRGCYWGKCAFCHYGLARHGTARYRERPVAEILSHLAHLSERHRSRVFYFSQDTMSPAMAHSLSQEILAAGLNIRWGTDMRPEGRLTDELCRQLAAGGAMSISLGIESAAPRVLKLINKGISAADGRSAITHLADAGIAVEVMCFTDFPTETAHEARVTLRLIRDLRDRIALFICGDFALVHGSAVARNPSSFGIRETWHAAGDRFRTGLFYETDRLYKNERDYVALDAAVHELSQLWWFRSYPWAGSLSTAHTLLWYKRYGPDVFRRFAATRHTPPARQTPVDGNRAQLEAATILANARQQEAGIWEELIHGKRMISSKAYHQLANKLPSYRLKHSARSKPTPGRRPR